MIQARINPLAITECYSSNLDDDIDFAEAIVQHIYKTHDFDELTLQDKLQLAQIHSRLALAQAARTQVETLLDLQ